MRDSFVIVYNEGNDRTSYIVEYQLGVTTTKPSVVDATLYDTWDDAWSKIMQMREQNKRLGYETGMMFPMSVSKKDIFKAKLKGR